MKPLTKKYSLCGDYKLMQKLLLGPRQNKRCFTTNARAFGGGGSSTGSWRASQAGSTEAINQDWDQHRAAKRYWKKRRKTT